LKKSISYVADVLRKEIAIIGRENVVLWGLSQGCATSLATLLTWDNEPFGAVIGMCGYLPLANLIEEVSESRSFGSPKTVPSRVGSEEDDDGVEEGMKRISEDPDEDLFYPPAGEDTSDDPFSPFDDDINSTTDLQSSCDRAEFDLPTEAIIRFREGLVMEQHLAMSFQKIPIFLGHGDMDEKVSLDLGLQAKKCLAYVGANVQMETYAGLGHWFSEDMISDIFLYLHRKLTPKTI
jgi:predicted esterase